ncbi:hypothetical protein CWT02_0849 [Salmonella enterica subsp. enterica serovar Cubana]|nr:hypothetical protein CWT02_0849 [Salmonella enterica subsp. enterica serovar Cubana]
MFIPADAGNIFQPLPTAERPSVYPRWRGEHLRPNHTDKKNDGLSPLARGTPAPDRGHRWRTRFIPAGAGNTIECYLAKDVYSVYPRWRGEHTQRPERRTCASGLSPLARGTPTQITNQADISRFIPAGAGNT